MPESPRNDPQIWRKRRPAPAYVRPGGDVDHKLTQSREAHSTIETTSGVIRWDSWLKREARRIAGTWGVPGLRQDEDGLLALWAHGIPPAINAPSVSRRVQNDLEDARQRERRLA